MRLNGGAGETYSSMKADECALLPILDNDVDAYRLKKE